MEQKRDAAQRELWDGPAGEKWVTYQAEMDRNFADVTAGVLRLADAKPGERVLDVGCGAGQTSRLLAEAVGPNGHVTGVDISTPMLAAARRDAPQNTDFLHGDAAFQPFAPEYDLIFSRFGVMFFADPVSAFANLRRAARPGGRLAFVCWRPGPENEWVTVPLAAAKPYLPETPPPDPDAPGQFAFADPSRVEAILTKAGFSQVKIDRLDGRMDLGASSDAAALLMTNCGALSRALSDVGDEAVRDRVRAAVKTAFDAIRTDGRIAPGIACWLVSARA